MRLFVTRCLVLFLSRIADLQFLLDIASPELRRWQFKLMRFKVHGRIRVGHQIYFRNFGNIEMGEDCCIGSFSKFWNYSTIKFGKNFMGAGNLVVNTASHKPDTLHPFSNEVIIGDNVWCGVNVTILGGITIGNNVTVGANSLVKDNLPDNCIAVGIPAKVVKFIETRDEDKMFDPFIRED